MSWFRKAFGDHYSLLYRHRDDDEARICIENLPRLAPLGAGPVLDLGCGEGRHLSYLADGTSWALGLDLSPWLLAEAQQRLGSSESFFGLVRGDMRQLPLSSSRFSAVLSLFTSFGYFGGLEDHDGMVAEIARVLQPQGHWFLDYLNCQAVRRELSGDVPDMRRREIEPFAITEQRQLVADPPRVIKSVTLQPLPGLSEEAGQWNVPTEGLAYAEEVALFSLAQLDAMAQRHGLRRVAQAGGYLAQQLDQENSPRWLLVFQKQDVRGGHHEGSAPSEGGA